MSLALSGRFASMSMELMPGWCLHGTFYLSVWNQLAASIWGINIRRQLILYGGGVNSLHQFVCGINMWHQLLASTRVIKFCVASTRGMNFWH